MRLNRIVEWNLSGDFATIAGVVVLRSHEEGLILRVVDQITPGKEGSRTSEDLQVGKKANLRVNIDQFSPVIS